MNVGQVLLAVWFIVWGLRKFVPLLGHVYVEWFLGLLAIAIGILIILGR